MLWFLLLLPILVIAYILLQKRRQKYALRYASLSLVKEALGRGPGIRRHIPPLLFLIGVAVTIVALARPAATILVPSYQGTVILTIDISGSMRADDLKPSRLEAAKSAALGFVDKQPQNVRIGIVAFSATSALVQAPTRIREDVLAAINRLAIQRGTAVGSGMLTSLRAIFEDSDLEPPPSLYESLTPTDSTLAPVAPGSLGNSVIVLLSDGQSNRGPDPWEVAQQAADLGVRVYTVGVGSPEGVVMNFRGHSVRVRLDEEALKSIAKKTEGDYFNADNEKDLFKIYESLSTKLISQTEKTELTAIFTGISMVIFLIAATLSMIWFKRLP
jgi:Ca-activated chloride channel family protein